MTVLEGAPNVWPLDALDSKQLVDLPVFASRFIGREREADELQRRLERSRLVTLTGPAGTGKTRLALEVAGRLEARGGRPHLIELAGLTEGRLLPETFVAALGIMQAQTRSPLDSLLDWVAENDDVLVVDNCEHLIEATAALVDQILRRRRHITVLATSREPLHIDGEVVWPVPTLSVPPDDAPLSVIARSEAVMLFVERARQAAPGFALTKDNATQVASICRQLDGLALAIEVAAVRVAAFDLGSITQELSDRFRFLTGGFRTAPPRQRTLRAAIDWSYELLTDAERQLFDRSSVFAGSFDVAAAEAVCTGGAVLRQQVLDLLGRLIDKSLVTPISPSAERKRYRVLETFRAYGLDRLRDAGELDALRRKHALHFASLSEIDPDPNDRSRLPRTRLDIANLREALLWSRDAEPSLHLRLAVFFGTYCMRAGLMSEGRTWLEPLIDAGSGDRRLLTRANEMAALLAWRQGDFGPASRFAVEAVRLGRSLKDDVELARMLGTFAFIQIGALRLVGVAEALEELLSIAKRHRDQAEEADALFYMGLLEAHGEDAHKARDLLHRSVALYEAAGKSDVIGTAYNTLAWVLLRLNDLPAARSAIANGIEVRAAHHEVADMVSSLESSAELAFLEGNPARAMRLKGAADAQRDAHRSARPSMAVASQARWTPRAERQLGRKARAAWLEGRRLNLEEAVRYALAAADQTPPHAAREGERSLSTREVGIADLVAEGLSNDEIAARLNLSRRTVEAHLDHIRGKLGARSRVDVAIWAASRSPRQTPSQS